MIKKFSKLLVGYLLIVLGIIGLFTPILQGVLFLALGTMILSSQSPAFRKLLDRIKTKYPNFYAALLSRMHKKQK